MQLSRHANIPVTATPYGTAHPAPVALYCNHETSAVHIMLPSQASTQFTGYSMIGFCVCVCFSLCTDTASSHLLQKFLQLQAAKCTPICLQSGDKRASQSYCTAGCIILQQLVQHTYQNAVQYSRYVAKRRAI